MNAEILHLNRCIQLAEADGFDGYAAVLRWFLARELAFQAGSVG